MISSCTDAQVLGGNAAGTGVECQADVDTNTTYTASGTILQLVGTAFSLKEGTLTTTKGCKYVAGTGIVCDQDYLTAESDPQVGDVTIDKWCAGNGSAVVCDKTAPVLTETDPVAGAVNGILKANGAGTISAASAGTDYVVPAGKVATATALAANGGNCTTGNYPLGVDASGAVESCTALPSETDPQVGAVTDDKVCQGDGSAVQCDLTQDGSGTCAPGAICTGGHTHPPSEISGTKVIAQFTISNGDTAIAATVTDPVACTRIANNSIITGWYIDADQSGSIVLDVWKNTWDDTPETNTDSIAGTEKPTLSGDVSASDISLGSMTTDWNAGDNVCIEVESAETLTKTRVQFVGYND